MAKKLFVGNLPFSAQESALSQLFSQHGEVTAAKIVMDRNTGRSKGFGFVEMPDDAGADAAIAALNGYEYEGRKIYVEEARPQASNGGGGGGGRPRFGGGGGGDRRGGGGGGRGGYGGGGGGRGGGGRGGYGGGRGGN